jgi:hypothetical protein
VGRGGRERGAESDGLIATSILGWVEMKVEEWSLFGISEMECNDFLVNDE